MPALCAWLLLAGLSCIAAEVGTPFDLQRFINQELSAGKKRIVVPPGVYRVAPKDRQHLLLHRLTDVEITADGVEMICTETTRAVTIHECTNVILRGLVIDHDPLPYTQGRITGFDADKKVHEIELFDGYPPAEEARNAKYEIFRPDTRTLRCEDRYVSKLEVVDSRHLRLTVPAGRATNAEQVGDLVVIAAQHTSRGSMGHDIFLLRSSKVRLENITEFSGTGFGFLEEYCEGNTYYHCRIERRPAAQDFVKRASPRLRTLNADAFHSKHATKGPAYIECAARFMGDDCININGDYHMVMECRGKELRVLAKHNMNIQPGDPLELVTFEGQRLGDAKALSVQPDGKIRDEERAFQLKQRMHEQYRLTTNGALNKAFLVTLDREVNLPRGSVIAAMNRMGNGFVVKGCDFGYNRSRGILIKASQGEVTGNKLEGCEMSAILVAPEYWWLESGSSSEVKITGNTITACKGVPICIEGAAGNGKVAAAGLHRNILISGNTIKDCSMPGMIVCSTTGLTITNNTLELNVPRTKVPQPMRQAGLTEMKPVVEINCAP